MGEICREAARQGLKHPMVGGFVHELNDIPAAAYHLYLEYHQKIQREATALAVDFRWIPRGVPISIPTVAEIQWDGQRTPCWFSCTSCRNTSRTCTLANGTTVNPARWWIDTIDRSRDIVKDRPSSEAVLNPATLEPAITAMSTCNHCGKYTNVEEFKAFMRAYAQEVQKKTSEVSPLSMHLSLASV
jgi:hypothetical protein